MLKTRAGNKSKVTKSTTVESEHLKQGLKRVLHCLPLMSISVMVFEGQCMLHVLSVAFYEWHAHGHCERSAGVLVRGILHGRHNLRMACFSWMTDWIEWTELSIPLLPVLTYTLNMYILQTYAFKELSVQWPEARSWDWQVLRSEITGKIVFKAQFMLTRDSFSSHREFCVWAHMHLEFEWNDNDSPEKSYLNIQSWF